VAFLAIIWFTWLQVTLFDIRFARDSIFERCCKAVQLATMVGFASAGSGFTTQIREENVWIFHSFSLLLSASRCLLGVQYLVAGRFLQKAMPVGARTLTNMGLLFFAASFTYASVSSDSPKGLEALSNQTASSPRSLASSRIRKDHPSGLSGGLCSQLKLV
jgi:hypothetical protein